MEKKKVTHLVYNLLVILTALIMGIYHFPSTLSQFAFLIIGIGIFFTLELIIPKAKRNLKLGFTISFLITFSLLFVITFWN
ncbi:hypothetical protein EV282_2730 [Fictibacillus sp. BK138]|nr:hypothetical protein EV282_2730 [Fictibacillus sp. BK138]